jgi:branched-chain amino acid aminotransferase
MEKAVLAVFSQSPEIRYLRLVVTRGIGSLGLSPTSCSRPSIIIIPGAWKTYYSSEKYQKGLTAIIAKTRTKSPKGLSPNIKSLNYLQNILARLEAIKARVDEAIMLTEDGYLAEACVDNLFIVTDDQTILTPPKEIVLEGITRATVMELAQKIGFKVKEKLLRPLDLEMAEEIFLTGTAAEIIGVVEVDGRKVGSGRVGEVTKKLMAEFKKVVGIPETGTKIPQKEVRLI